MRKGILDGGHNRNCQGLKLSEKWFLTRRKLIEKKRDSDNETQTLESWRRDTCVSTLHIQNFNQNGVICMTRKEEEEKENKSAAKSLKKSEEEERCGYACPDSRLSRDEIFTTDYNIPNLHDASSILGAPNDTYERLSDIRYHGKVSRVKWPLTIRVCNSCRVSKVISERVFTAKCLQTNLTRYRIETNCLRADSPMEKNGRNVEENSYGTVDKMPRVFSPKSFKNVPKKASPILRVKKKSTSSNLRGKKLIAVKGCFTKRKKVAKYHKKKKTYGEQRDTDNEVGISLDSDDVVDAEKGKDNEQVEKFDEFFCEPSGSQDLANCSSKCQNIMQTKSNHRSFSEMGIKTDSTKTFKIAKNNSSKSEKKEWEDFFSQRSNKIVEKFKPKTTPNSVIPLNKNKVRSFK